MEAHYHDDNANANAATAAATVADADSTTPTLVYTSAPPAKMGPGAGGDDWDNPGPAEGKGKGEEEMMVEDWDEPFFDKYLLGENVGQMLRFCRQLAEKARECHERFDTKDWLPSTRREHMDFFYKLLCWRRLLVTLANHHRICVDTLTGELNAGINADKLLLDAMSQRVADDMNRDISDKRGVRHGTDGTLPTTTTTTPPPPPLPDSFDTTKAAVLAEIKQYDSIEEVFKIYQERCKTSESMVRILRYVMARERTGNYWPEESLKSLVDSVPFPISP
jgi:hypothetical protein